MIHLGERECSIQRRNQKIIEEAPSPLLDARTRQAMGEQAVRLAKAVHYDSAGTVEFVAGQDKSFYFLEMNTRLQVEHPVTEALTGLDLVEYMIRIAAGEPLQIEQGSVRLEGWAIECRIYAEDPHRGFLPSTGRLKAYKPPKEGPLPGGASVRIDNGVYEGGEISVHYDPMIAKVVTHAADRVGAIEAMAGALDSFHIDGIRHNTQFLAAIMNNERWRRGELSNGFIAEEFPGGFTGASIDTGLKCRIIAIGAAMHVAELARKRKISGQFRSMPTPLPRRLSVRFEEEWHSVDVSPDTSSLWIGNESLRQKYHVETGWSPGQAIWRGQIDGRAVAAQVAPLLSGYRISHGGMSTLVHVTGERESRLTRLMPVKTAKATSSELRCPMPGVVVSLHVVSGQDVKAGDTLAIVEAMKMQNILRAERDGKVRKLLAKPGDTLAVEAVIMEFE